MVISKESLLFLVTIHHLLFTIHCSFHSFAGDSCCWTADASGVVRDAWPVGGGGSAGGGVGTCGGGAPGSAGSPGGSGSAGAGSRVWSAARAGTISMTTWLSV